MDNLFLDSNTYLGFYSLSPRDVAELERLAELIDLKKLSLVIPTQVKDEVRRNRARVVADRLKQLQDSRIQVSVPQMAAGTPAAEDLVRSAADANRAHSRLMKELRQLARDGLLPGDRLVARLFKSGREISNGGAFERAAQRKALGNPPGKGSSLGDGVSWEILLSQVPGGDPLHVVTADADFASALNPEQFDEFLLDEWSRTKGSSIFFYRDIKGYLDEEFPQIRLASDVTKYFLIESIVESGSFTETHDLTAQLLPYGSLTQDEALRLLTGGIENNQVRWLARDEDVAELLRLALGPHKSVLPKQLVRKWEFVMEGGGLPYGPAPSDEDLDRPLKDIDLE